MSLVQFRPEAPPASSLAGICGHSSSGRAPPCQGGGSEFEPRCPLQSNQLCGLSARITSIRRHSQVVRQRTANPRFPSSNLGGASTSEQSPLCSDVFYFPMVNKKRHPLRSLAPPFPNRTHVVGLRFGYCFAHELICASMEDF